MLKKPCLRFPKSATEIFGLKLPPLWIFSENSFVLVAWPIPKYEMCAPLLWNFVGIGLRVFYLLFVAIVFLYNANKHISWGHQPLICLLSPRCTVVSWKHPYGSVAIVDSFPFSNCLCLYICIYLFLSICLCLCICICLFLSICLCLCAGKFTWRCPRCPRWGFSSDCWSSAARTCCQLRNKSSQNANELTKAWRTTFWDIFGSPFITLFFIPLTGE